METQPPRFIYITSDIPSAVDEFDLALNSLVESLVIRAAMGNSTKFATGESKFGGYLHIYGLMQCVQEFLRLIVADVLGERWMSIRVVVLERGELMF